MLRITDYCPEIADNLLSTIIDRAIQIDVSPCCSPVVLIAEVLINTRNPGRDTGRARGTRSFGCGTGTGRII